MCKGITRLRKPCGIRLGSEVSSSRALALARITRFGAHFGWSKYVFTETAQFAGFGTSVLLPCDEIRKKQKYDQKQQDKDNIATDTGPRITRGLIR